MSKIERVLKKDKLKHLYWKRGLSTAEIGKMFKITHQMVSYLALKHGIKLRPPRGVQKKKYKISKKLLKNLYIKQKLSIPKIAKKFGIKSYSTIAIKLLQNGIPIRSMSEAKTKYQKLPFSGNQNEKAYLLGLRAGDISAVKDWFRIRVVTTSTHPAQVEMMKNVFGKYTHVTDYIHEDKRGIKEFHVQADLHQSFDFLLKKLEELPSWIINNNGIFYSFLAGYSDCEANWNISKRYKNSFQIEFNLRTNDKKILRQLYSKLNSQGLSAKFRLYTKKGEKATYGVYTKDLFSVRINKRRDVIRLARSLLPLSKHKERIDRMTIIASINENTKWKDVETKVLNLRKAIKESRLQ